MTQFKSHKLTPAQLEKRRIANRKYRLKHGDKPSYKEKAKARQHKYLLNHERKSKMSISEQETLIEILFAASEESISHKFESDPKKLAIDKAIHFRQKIYNLRRATKMRIDWKDKLDTVQVRIVDQDKQSINFKSKDYQASKAQYAVCYVITEPRNFQYESQLQKTLNEIVERKGMLPSQALEQQSDKIRQSITKNNAIDNPMDNTRNLDTLNAFYASTKPAQGLSPEEIEAQLNAKLDEQERDRMEQLKAAQDKAHKPE